MFCDWETLARVGPISTVRPFGVDTESPMRSVSSNSLVEETVNISRNWSFTSRFSGAEAVNLMSLSTCVFAVILIAHEQPICKRSSLRRNALFAWTNTLYIINSLCVFPVLRRLLLNHEAWTACPRLWVKVLRKPLMTDMVIAAHAICVRTTMPFLSSLKISQVFTRKSSA